MPPDEIQPPVENPSDKVSVFDLDEQENLKEESDGPNADAQAVLGETVESLKKRINEERFLFSAAIFVLFDSFFFQGFDNTGSAIVIGLLELAALAVLARRLNVSDLLVLIDSIASAFRR